MDSSILHSSRLSPAVRSRIVLGVILFMFVVGGLLLIYLLHDMDWTLVRQIGLPYLVIILLLSVLSILVYGVVVYILISASGHRTTFVQAYLVLTTSLSANYFTPIKVGIPLRIYLYKHFMDIPVDIGTALIAVETMVGILTPAFIAVAGIALIFPSVGLVIPMTVISLLVFGMIIVLRVRVENLQLYLARFPFLSFVARFTRFFERVQWALRQLPITKIVQVVLLVVVMLGLHSMRLWLVLRILGFQVSPLALLAVLTISLTAGNLSMIPMGLGVRDASFTLLLTQLGIPSEIALAAAVIQRLFSPGWPLLLGLISANILGVSELVKRSDESSVAQ
jgi:uncharacterized protein (TIRG00374 family)